LRVWPAGGGIATVAFEDLEIDGGNDYDYNDFVTDISVLGTYSRGNLAQLEFSFEAQARGSRYVHDLHLLIPASTFGSDGTYTIELYETDGTLLSSTAGSFTGDTDLDLVIFDDTWDALPPNPGQSSKGNTIDGCGVQPGRVTKVFLDFNTPFAFDLGDYSPEEVGVHGDNLFFDPYLYVRDTGEEIHITDQRLIVVPTDWEWPEDHAALWDVYPYNATSGEGVIAGDPPSFTTYWYTEIPTDKKWTP
jgi:LruC domain-containing protein